MYLLKKINNNTSFTFEKILISGYEIDEQPNTISKVQFVNGNRKRVYTPYEDCIIKINLGGVDATDFQNYLSNLTDGEYQYWSFKHNEYRNANFLVEMPSIVASNVYAQNNFYLDDISITLEKSSDVE